MMSARTVAAMLALTLTGSSLVGCAATQGAEPAAVVATASHSEGDAASTDASSAPTPVPTYEIGQRISVDERATVRDAGLDVYEDRKGRGWVWDPWTPGMPRQAIKDIKATMPVYAGQTNEAMKKGLKEMWRISAQMRRQYPVMVTQGGSYDEGGNLLYLNGWGMASTGPILEYGETWPTREAAIAGVKAKIAAAENPEWFIYIDLD